jgi:hypothetical protein
MLYHLVINTAKTGLGGAAEIIARLALQHHREYLQTAPTLVASL